MIDFLRRILRSPEGDGGNGGGNGDGGDGGAGDGGAGGDGGDGGDGDQGAGKGTWIDTLPENVRSGIPEEYTKDPNVTKFKNIPDFLKSHISLGKMVGAKGVIVPKDDAKPEEVEKFYNALGRPEKPEGYKIDVPKDLHKSIVITPESISGYQMLAHKHGLSQKQADGLNKDWLTIQNKIAVENERAEIEAAQTAETKLRTEWGSKFEAKRDMIAKAMLRAGGQEALDAMGGVEGLGNNIPVMRAWGNLIGLLSEDSINTLKVENGGSGDGQHGNETPEQAIEKIRAMNSDPKHPFMDEKHPDHDKAIEERKRLYKIAYPGSES